MLLSSAGDDSFHNQDGLQEIKINHFSLHSPTEMHSSMTTTVSDVIEYADNADHAEYATSTEERENSSISPIGDSEGTGFHDSNNLSFYVLFMTSGPAQIIFCCMLYALSVGSTIGVIPSVMTDQFAKFYHNFDYSDSCANYGKVDIPQACVDGSSDAQTAAVSVSFVSNILIFMTSSLIGSISDEYGRRKLLNTAQFLSLFSPIGLIMMQTSTYSSMNPNTYYILQCFGGCISWLSIAISALSDTMPKKWRAATFGLLLSGYSLGIALSPLLALAFTHYGVSILSFLIMFGAFLFGLFFIPETLSDPSMHAARIRRREHQIQDEVLIIFVARMLSRPIKEISILNRNCLFRLFSAIAFFSGMGSSADQTLLVYFVENRLAFNDHDIAMMFGLIGVLGIFVQGVVLKPFTGLIGESYVVVVSFICGAVTNALYAFARSKQIIFFAVCVSSLGTMSFPTISAMVANNVEAFEQGRIQGAICAVCALSRAVGPCLLRLAYQQTKDTNYPGSFFLVATFFFIVATICGWALPKDRVNSDTNGKTNHTLRDDEAIRERLLPATE